MAHIATPEFLAQMKSLFPGHDQLALGKVSPWAFVVATAFSASNLPEAVPFVFEFALRDAHTDSARLLLVRKIKDAIFKSGMLSGYPKAINAIAQLHAVVPLDLCETKTLRDTSMSTEDFNRVGQEFFSHTYGENTESVQSLLRDIYPDLEFFSTTFAYGYTYAFSEILTPAETSFAMMAALIASDTPRQIDWHLRGAVRNGASKEEVSAVREIAIRTARVAGVVWKNEIPDVEG